MFAITKEWLFEHRQNKNGAYYWIAEQLHLLDLHPPLQKGWMDRLEGKLISEQDKAQFEDLANPTPIEDPQQSLF